MTASLRIANCVIEDQALDHQIALERIASVEEDRDIYRAMAVENIHERAALVAENKSLRRQLAALRDELRRYLHRQATRSDLEDRTSDTGRLHRRERVSGKVAA